MTTDISTTSPRPPAEVLPGVATGALGKRLGEFVDLALEGKHTAAMRNGRRPAVLVGAGWYNQQPGAHHHVMSVRTPEDHPIDRDAYAESLETMLDDRDADGPEVVLRGREAEVFAAALDELAAVYRGEDFGHLARRLAVRLYDRAGV